MRRILRYIGILTISALLSTGFTACDKNVKWTETKALPEEGWQASQPAIFNLDPEAYRPLGNKYEEMTAKAVGDTIKRMRGSFMGRLSLRYKDACNAREMKLIMETASLDTDIKTDTLSILLFSDNGRSTGRGRFGLNEIIVPLQKPVIVGEGTTISFQPLDYTTPVEGLLSITLTLSEYPRP